MTILTALLPMALTVVGLLPMVAVVLVWRARERRLARESPLVRDMLRPPGHSLRAKIDELDQDIDLYLLTATIIPLLVFSVYVSQSHFAGEPDTALRVVTSISLGALGIAIVGWRLLSLFDARKRFVLGLQGELATGEELNQLMLDGCRVFHDIPFQYGNIDHVVVSHSGVFAVNTKMHQKRNSGTGKGEIAVDYRRGVIRFPDRDAPIHAEQLQAEASWLSEHLSNSTGQGVKVEPILALPGWFVKERIGQQTVLIINPHRPKRFFVHNRRVLSDQLAQQVAHQLEQLCRDVPRLHQKKHERWEKRT